MNIFYENLPFPVFLTITFLFPIIIISYFYKRKSEYPTSFLIGVMFLCLSAVSAGVVKVLKEFNLLEEYSHLFGGVPIPFILLTAPFIMVGAYKKVIHDEVKRKKIVFLSSILLLIIVFFVFLGFIKPWE